MCSEVVDRGSLERRGVLFLPTTEQEAGEATPARDTPMRSVHQDEPTREQLVLDLDEIARQGARKMLSQALQAEVQAYLQAAEGECDERDW